VSISSPFSNDCCFVRLLARDETLPPSRIEAFSFADHVTLRFVSCRDMTGLICQQEPITFFGESTGQLPAAYMTTANPTTTAVSGINAAAAAATAVSSSSEAPAVTSLSSRTGGPAANQAQQTASNVFGAADANGSASSSLSKALAGSIFAGIAGAAFVFA
jgi:hypothetical protein